MICAPAGARVSSRPYRLGNVLLFTDLTRWRIFLGPSVIGISNFNGSCPLDAGGRYFAYRGAYSAPAQGKYRHARQRPEEKFRSNARLVLRHRTRSAICGSAVDPAGEHELMRLTM